MSQEELDIEIRNVQPSDFNLIISSFLHHFQNQKPYSYLDKNIYYSMMKSMLLRLLPMTNIIVACDPEYPDQVYGYLIASKDTLPTLHFLYTRKPYRRLQVAERLLESVWETHRSIRKYYTFPTLQTKYYLDKWNLQPFTHGVLEEMKQTDLWY